MKAMLWALVLPNYFRVQVEAGTGDRFKPDVIGRDESDAILFWGEAGHTDPRKMKWVARRYPRARLVFARWNDSMRQYIPLVARAVRGLKRRSSVEVWNFPADSADRFFQGTDIVLRADDIEIAVVSAPDASVERPVAMRAPG